jgi:hypothetical protein
MICNEFERQWSELDDIAHLPVELQEHRGGCPRCAQLFGDLTGILQQARAMRLDEEPPQRVWASLRNQLEIEGLIKEPSQERVKPAAWRGWLLRLPMGLAYASVFFMALGVTYLYHRSANPGPASQRAVATAPAPAAPAAASPAVSPSAGSNSNEQLAANRVDSTDRDKKVEALLAKVPEERRATLEQNWHQVNTAVANLSSFAATHPDDPFVQEQLSNVQQQRELFVESLVQWDEF